MRSRFLPQSVATDGDRLGSGTTRRADVRLIAATNRDLALAIQEGRFREDLFYRLNVFPIQLPPLRDRAEDTPALAEYFVQRAAVRLRRRFSGIDQMLASTRGNMQKAAEILDINPRTLYRMVARYKLRSA